MTADPVNLDDYRRLRRAADLLDTVATFREERDETIRALIRAGESVTRIADEAGMSRQSIYRIAGDLIDDWGWHVTKGGDR